MAAPFGKTIPIRIGCLQILQAQLTYLANFLLLCIFPHQAHRVLLVKKKPVVQIASIKIYSPLILCGIKALFT